MQPQRMAKSPLAGLIGRLHYRKFSAKYRSMTCVQKNTHK